ncbi:hypothetical protein J433_12767 [Corynebacterium glutamicum MT]|nr:hypothetical protein C624_02795 [Corynebacterium glutamicum SCgG1]AGN21169.1 hypothetical protein C629_02795 [Corynebacterium glutamicum SCgG2]EGV39009.1 hypothetical protein CgS9114_15338 [Corynebacterium glutamicum S9114]EOA63570.1 hypothetical protein J433_12767 [Corynebacterium glutamicum MT]EPP41888.1 hypothetical protein A583_02331 [Corynebacterium glutamicum Z188]NII88387.1 IS6 family transposase [Corynebacterium glutamicum]
MRPISGSAAGGATSDLAITVVGQTLEFYLSPKRNVAAANCFLAKAITELKSEGICPPTVEHRQVKYLNNVLEGDHGRLKRILGPKGAFKNLDICISDAEGDGSDALLAERSGDDVCLRATEPGRGDRQPGVRGCLRTPTRSEHQRMKTGSSRLSA